MKKTMMIAALLALPVGLSGCGKKAETPKAEAPKAEASTGAMPGMEMPVGSKMGKGSGTVTAIDAAAGKITLDHGAIPAVDWPAMKMGFSAKPELLKGVAVGDKVDFDVTVTGSAGEVTAIKKQ
ncbi:copper-binding protein [Novosphingobium aquiterrae]|uniref:Copper-binding protein n=1 Tax=Novosphingobium aquiterrae TaxID=624388 RepID=A0ABV6PHW1_9SPHN